LGSSSRVMIEFFVRDPWQVGPAGDALPDTENPALITLDLGAPARRLESLDAALAERPDDFDLRLERACLKRDIGDQEGSDQDLYWILRRLEQANLQRVLHLRKWLWRVDASAFAQVFEARLLSPEILRRLLAASEAGELGREAVDDVFNSILLPDRLEPESAHVLLRSGNERVTLASLRSLVALGDPRAVEEILRRVQDRRLSERDAISLLSVGGSAVIKILEGMADGPFAIRLLDGLTPELGDQIPVVKPGDWVHSSGGWGQIERIVHPTSGSDLPHFIRGHASPILHIVLRAGDREPPKWVDPKSKTVQLSLLPHHSDEPAVLDQEQGIITFGGQDPVFICSKCGAFMSRDCYRIVGPHDREAHDGIGPKFAKVGAGSHPAGKISFSHRRPMRIWS